MAIKVQCPECRHEMTLKTFKAGRFKPTCTQCKMAFQLVIGEGESPEVKTAKLAGTAPKPIAASATSPSTASAAGVTAVPAAETIARDMPTPAKAKASDQTIEHDDSAMTRHRSAAPVKASDQTSDQTIEHVDSAMTRQRSSAFSVDPPDQPVAVTAADKDVYATVAMGRGSTVRASSPPPSTSTRQDAQSSAARNMPERLGGYRIMKELGRGGMGAVYLAKQLSLDRNVAVKTIQNDWSANPRAVARFIREAYAAAQLTHHNVVQIYDLGQDSGVNFFSMELVEGGSLDDLLKRQGPLKPKQAATYILHAARGLRFAHDHGMIHRDIKPANLMLTSDCLVKVADLGLVKTPSQADDEQTRSDADSNIMLASARSHVTGAGSTLGTPAYMAPEQAEDATSVDHRADIYSLGCTFYALLVGKPPFANRSAVEILSKIKTEPIARVDSLVKDVPPQLAGIVQKMTAKAPTDRYNSLSEVIEELEQYLDAGSQPTRQRADNLQQLADQLQQVPARKMIGLLPPVLLGLGVLGMVIGLLVSFKFSLFCALCLVATPVLLAAINGIVGQRSPVTQRARSLLMQSSISDWLTWGFGAIVLLVVLWVTGLIGWALAAVLVSAGVAAGVTFGVLLPHARQTKPIVDQAKEVMRDMRLEGMEESGIAAFIAEFAGKHWEGLLESLLGYEALRTQRAQPATAGQRKSSSWLPSWRDVIVDRLDARLNAKREQREQRVLAKVESASLQAAGVSKKEAEEQASAMADSLVTAASQTRQLVEQTGKSGQTDMAKRDRIKQMLAAARSGKPQTKMARASRATGQLLNQLVGGKLRFAVGALLLVGCAMWANQNQLFNKEKLTQVGSALQSSAEKLAKTGSDIGEGQAVATKVGQQVGNLIGKTKPLDFPMIGSYFTSFAPGIIGLLIMLSSLVGSWRLTIPALSAAAVTLLSPMLGLPSFGLEHGAAWLGCAIGVALLLLPVVLKPLR